MSSLLHVRVSSSAPPLTGLGTEGQVHVQLSPVAKGLRTPFGNSPQSIHFRFSSCMSSLLHIPLYFSVQAFKNIKLFLAHKPCRIPLRQNLAPGLQFASPWPPGVQVLTWH